jgi:hypothetical protein
MNKANDILDEAGLQIIIFSILPNISISIAYIAIHMAICMA